MRRSIRAPFVMTTAVVASSAMACSAHDGGGPNPPCPDCDVADTLVAADVSFDASDTAPDAEANPPDCPASDPGIGARQTCTADSSIRCTYPDLCPSHPGPYAWNGYACKDDGTGKHWTLVSDLYTPVCPKVQPKDGDPCPCTIHMGFDACNYGACESMTMIYAACKGVDTFDPVWHVKSIACNPPEPDAGFLDVRDDAATDAVDSTLDSSSETTSSD